MKLIYTHENIALVGSARNLLDAAGISCVIRNQFAGGGVGELSYVQSWPELWALEDADYGRACACIEDALERADAADWCCERCGETNAAAFELCWQCASPAH
jgi:hypothetical protein